jgi:hypothetical protein
VFSVIVGMGAWKYLVIAVLFLVACAAQPEPAEQVPELVVSEEQLPTSTPTKLDLPPSAEELGISVSAGKVGFLSPMMKPGQTATYKVTTTQGTFTRSYDLIEFYHNSDPCVGIQRNSTVVGEFKTQTMWCDDTKYVFVWNEKRLSFDTPQVLGRDDYWSDESVQGFSVTEVAYEGAEKITVPAGTFWTLHKSVFDGVKKTDIWASPQVPGFEAGMVKRVVIEGSQQTTTELVSFGGLNVTKK